jgi:hypothetical protein
MEKNMKDSDTWPNGRFKYIKWADGEEIYCDENGRFKYIKWTDGEEIYCDENGFYSRLDGPAIIRSNGSEEYWLNGKRFKDIKSDEEWMIKQIIE